MIEHEEASDAGQRPGRPWYLWDILLFGGFAFVYALLFASVWLGGYIHGLRNEDPLISAFRFCWLVPVMLAWLLVLAVRMAISWPRHVRGVRRLAILYLLVSVGLLVWLAVPFLDLWPTPHAMFMRGFKGYVRASVDVESTRQWLSTVELARYGGEAAWASDRVEWPPWIKALEPGYVQVLPDESGRPMMRMSWGGPFGHWGLVVGDEAMETPPSDFSRYGEVRETIAPGVYVWYELQ